MTTLMSSSASNAPTIHGSRNNKLSITRERKSQNKNTTNKSTNVGTNSDKNSASGSSVATNSNMVSSSSTNDDFRKTDKFQPTAEQMRIANLMNDRRDDDLKPKIDQIVELTGASREDAAVALYDCDDDMTKAIEMILDGESFNESEWQSTGRKKNKAQKAQQLASADEILLTNGSGGQMDVGGGKSSNFDKANNRSNKNAKRGQPGKNKKKDGRNESSGGVNNVKNFETDQDSANKLSNNNQSSNFNSKRSSRRAPVGGGNSGGNNTGSFRSTGGNRGGGSQRGGKVSGNPAGRGPRTFMNSRGGGGSGGIAVNSNNNNTVAGSGAVGGGNQKNNSDGFPNSIETWSNHTANKKDHQQSSSNKQNNDDLNTLTVGNWSDVAATEDWSEDDWTSMPMETKVFTPSQKVIAEKDEFVIEQQQQQQNRSNSKSHSINHHDSSSGGSQVFLSSKKDDNNATGGTRQQPTMSAILSGNIKRPSPASAGQVLLQQIQQQQQHPQDLNHTHHQYAASLYSKQATESIKSLVGLNSASAGPNDSHHHHQEPKSISNTSRLKQAPVNMPVVDSVVEMPTNNDSSMSNLAMGLSRLEFGTFQLNSNESSLFDSTSSGAVPVHQSNHHGHLSSSVNKNNDVKNLILSSANAASSNVVTGSTGGNSDSVSNFRNTSNPKSIFQHHAQLNDSLLSSSARDHDSSNVKQQSFQNHQQQQQHQVPYGSRKNNNEYISTGNFYKYDNNAYHQQPTYHQQQQQQQPQQSFNYYSTTGNNSNHPFGNQQQSSVSSSSFGAVQNYSTYQQQQQNNSKLRDIGGDGSVNASANSLGKQAYDGSLVGGSNAALSLMSSSTATTNAIKNTLSSSKGGSGIVPPSSGGGLNAAAQIAAVAQVQPQQVALSPAQFHIMGNPHAGVPISYYPNPYDIQFQPPGREHTYSQYAAPDIKYNRNPESDLGLSASSQTASALPNATQAAHNHFLNHPAAAYPPGYGIYLSFPSTNPYHNLQQASMYSHVQAATAQNPSATANPTAFGKPSSAAAAAGGAANYGSHSYNTTGYDSLGAAVQQNQPDYSKAYAQQQMAAVQQQHQKLTGANASDLVVTSNNHHHHNQPNLYSKAHSQMNKSYDKPNFQQASNSIGLTSQVGGGGGGQSAGYGAATNPYNLLPQQLHHFNSAVVSADSQSVPQVAVGGAGGGNVNQRNLSQAPTTGKNGVGATSGNMANPNYKINNWV